MLNRRRLRFVPNGEVCESKSLCSDLGVNVTVGPAPEQEGAAFGGLAGDSGTQETGDTTVDPTEYSGGGVESVVDPPPAEGQDVDYNGLLATFDHGPTMVDPYDPYA